MMIDASWQNQINAAAPSVALPAEIKKQAVAAFGALGFPTPKLEDWKYTNLSQLSSASFELKTETSGSKAAELVRSAKLAEDSIGVIAVVNGVVDWSLSSLSELPAGIRVHSLRQREQIKEVADSERISKKLGTITPIKEQALAALGTACATDGVVVLVDEGVKIEKPLTIVCVSDADETSLASYPRILVDAAANSSCVILESFVGTQDASYFTNTIAEFFLGDSARITHYRMQQESEAAFHVSAIDAVLGASSIFETFCFSFGAKLVRNDVRVVINGEGAHATLNGLTVLDNKQHVDNSTVLDHAVPNCTSHEFYKGIYGHKSRGVFSGMIIVRKDAQKTNAIQSNQALLLSRDAEIDSRPQLNIWADDVRCTHGATVGELDEDQLFYLMARGIPKSTARDMLIRGFAEGVIEQVALKSVREILEAELSAKLKRIPSEI